MTMGHTPTPWRVKAWTKSEAEIRGKANTHVCGFATNDDATRIVAAVNATADFTTEALEQGVVSELVEVVKSFRDFGCPKCGGDCASANPPVAFCPMRDACNVLAKIGAK